MPPDAPPDAPPVTPPDVASAAPPAGPSLVYDAGVRAANDVVGETAAGPFVPIRAALAAGRLDDADRLLAEERTRLTAGAADAGVALAELTGLAGDHAAAAGRLGSARWLWRLALQRFAAADAAASPAARTVAERLRLADQ